MYPRFEIVPLRVSFADEIVPSFKKGTPGCAFKQLTD